MKKIFTAALLFISFTAIYAQDLHPFEQNDKWGYKNDAGQIVVQAKYEKTSLFLDNGLGQVSILDENVKWKYGFVDKTGKVVIPVIYDHLGENFSSGLVAAGKGDKYGFLNASGQVAIPLKYDFVHDFSEGFAAVYSGKKWGFINTAGTIAVPMLYEEIKDMKSGMAGVKANGKWGFINNSGSVVISLAYDDVKNFNSDISGVQKNYKWAVIDRSGKLITDFKYSGVGQSYGSELIVVHISESKGSSWTASIISRYGVVNSKAQEIIPIMYDWVTIITRDLMHVKLNGKNGIVNSLNKTVLSVNYPDEAFYVTTDRVPQGYYIENGKRKLFSLDGAEVRVLKYDNSFSYDYFTAVEYKNKWGYLNSRGHEIVTPKYDSLAVFSEGLALVALGGKFGYIDTTGLEKIPVKYDFASPFQGGYAYASLAQKLGIIDKNNNQVVPIKYDDIKGFSENMAPVLRDNKWGYIDVNGKEVIQPTYEEAGYFSEGLAPVVVNKKIGFISPQGKMVIEPQFEGLVQLFENGYAIVYKNGKKVMIDKTGAVK